MLRIGVNTSQGVGRDPETKESYIRILRAMGYDVVIISPDMDVRHLERHVDGLLLIGGPDVPPEFYGGRCHPTIYQQEPNKVDHDFRIIHQACSKQIPLIGICAGMQTLGCYFGGKLLQHIPEAGSNQKHQDQDERHGLRSVSHKLAQLVASNNFIVNTRHHQCIETPGELTIDALSEDGFIEAVSHRDHPIVGVQWHPEDLALHGDLAMRRFFTFFQKGRCGR